MDEPMINSDLRLLAAVHSWWMNPNFKFLQGGDSDENRNGYQARHMLERYFTMDQELKQNNKKQWKTNTHFEEFIRFNSSLTMDEREEQEKKPTPSSLRSKDHSKKISSVR